MELLKKMSLSVFFVFLNESWHFYYCLVNDPNLVEGPKGSPRPLQEQEQGVIGPQSSIIEYFIQEA